MRNNLLFTYKMKSVQKLVKRLELVILFILLLLTLKLFHLLYAHNTFVVDISKFMSE